MKKRTIVIVSITLVLALLAVAVIATFPTYLFEDTVNEDANSVIQSGNITENDATNESDESGEYGDDVGVLGGGNDQNGAEAVLPIIDDKNDENDESDEDNKDDEQSDSNEVSETELDTIAEAKNVKVLAESGAFKKGTKIKIKKLGILDKSYYRSRHYLKGIAREFTAYNLSATKDGTTVFPVGTVRLSFTIPKDYDSNNVATYYLLEKGLQEIDCEISKDGKTASVKISQPGVYILVEKIAESDSEENSSTDDTSTENDKTESNTSSSASSSEDSSSNASSDSSDVSSDASNDSSDDSSNDTESDTSSDSDSSSDDTSSEDSNKETMDGWTPWY